jgi:hypothetical protein
MINKAIKQLKKIPYLVGVIVLTAFMSGLSFGGGYIIYGCALGLSCIGLIILFDKVLDKAQRNLEV